MKRSGAGFDPSHNGRLDIRNSRSCSACIRKLPAKTARCRGFSDLHAQRRGVAGVRCGFLPPTRLAQIRREPLATAHSSGRVAADPHRAQAQDSCGVAKVESHQTGTDDADSSLEVISV